MDTRHFHKQLDDAMLRLLGDSGVIVCAISGGVDSMALLHGLVRVCALRKRDWTLHVAHLDHGIPHNSAEMMQFVEDCAKEAGVPFHGEFVDVPALSRETGESIEEAGRKARYAFLQRVCEETGADALAVAHHADDQAETILHRVLRGTGLKGLAGIPESRLLKDVLRTRLIRPLLAFRRSDCVAYLERRGLGYMHDDTNDDVLAATRNRIRHDVLPTIEREINPQAVTAICRLGDLAKQASALVDALAVEAWDRCFVESARDEIHFDADLLAKERDLLQMAIVTMAIEQVGGARGEVGYERLQAAARMIASARREASVEFPDGCTAVKRGQFVVVSRCANADGAEVTVRKRRRGAGVP